ncbi:unnamed protein product [Cercopithifilaria johnstoni]|uniref:Uncharacterized protein n=1 Tax=Cercopithifilaria johnstoni TaxID=2874296 RepID=A0A8J2M190_9BILA|nr:unnamed protein product [Cercopithifilaria johnstoni]
MIDSNKMLEQTKLANKTETIFINDTNSAHYFMYSNIISDGRNVSETANLINNKLISYYRNDNEFISSDTDTFITTATDSSQLLIPYTTKETALTSISDDEKKSNHIVIQTISLKEYAPSTTTFYRNTDILGTDEQVTTVSPASFIKKLNNVNEDELSTNDIPKSTFNSTDSSESRNQKEDFIVEKMDIFSTKSYNDSTILDDYHFASTQSTTFNPIFLENSDSFAEADDMSVKNVVESTDLSIQSNNSTSTDQITKFVSSIANENEGVRNFLMETNNLHSINSDSITSNITIVPAETIFPKISTIDKKIVIEAKQKWTEALQIPTSDIKDSAHSLEDLIPTSNSINIDNLTNSQENSLFSDRNDESTKTTEKSDQSINWTNGEETARLKQNETELKGSTLTQPIQDTIISRNNYDANISNIPDIKKSGSITRQMNNGASILKLSHSTSEDTSNVKNSTMISNPEASKAFVQEDIHSSISDKNVEHFTLGRNNSFFTTEFSTALKKVLPKIVMNLPGTLTGASSSSSDEERLITTSGKLQSFAETSGIMKATSSSPITNNFFEDSELSTIATTESQDNEMVVSFITGRNHELITDKSLHTPFIASIAETINDEIVTANSFTIKSQIFPSKEIFDASQTTETSILSSLRTKNFIESSTITQNTIKGIQNAIEDDEIELPAITEKKQPVSVFNISLPALLYDAQFISYINRTSSNYNFLFLDEVSYTEEKESEVLDSSKIAFIMDDESTSLDNLGNDANETYVDFYLDDSISSVDDTIAEERFRLANLAVRNKQEIRFQPETTTIISVLGGTTRANTVSNWIKNAKEHHHSLFSADSDSSLHYLTKNTVAISTLENTQLPAISQDFEGLRKEFDDITSSHQEINATESITVSKIENPIKSDFTVRTTDENFNAPIAVRMVISRALNSIENPSNTLSSSIPSPEIEAIAATNINYEKIADQTITILKAKKPVRNNLSSSIISTTQWTSTVKPTVALSSDQIFLRELSTTTAHSHSQSQIDESTADRSKSEEWLNITDRNDNIADTFQTSTTDIISQSSSMINENSFLQNRHNMNKNAITSVSTAILNDTQNDTSLTIM